MVQHLFTSQGLEEGQVQRLLRKVRGSGITVSSLITEFCFNIDSDGELSAMDQSKVEWCLADGGHTISSRSLLAARDGDFLVEVGPRLSFTTAWSTNCVSVLKAAQVIGVRRLERSRRYLFKVPVALSESQKTQLAAMTHDRMTEMVYKEPLSSFESGFVPNPVRWIPVLKEGKKALEEINQEMGLGFDEWDYDYYMKLYTEDLKRDPSDVELFDFAQSNSEHSRHWFFGGKMVIDGQEKEESLFRIVKDTLQKKSEVQQKQRHCLP